VKRCREQEGLSFLKLLPPGTAFGKGENDSRMEPPQIPQIAQIEKKQT
jgi:hypothetical protein